jgi:ribose/xylose/arabinose/galactoside ABC-type transport system permease subunit
MRRILIWTAIGVPVGATFFGLLVFVAARLSNSPACAPVAMGAVVGVLAGVFFGMWNGVVASVNETEHANLVLRQSPNA